MSGRNNILSIAAALINTLRLIPALEFHPTIALRIYPPEHHTKRYVRGPEAIAVLSRTAACWRST
jgi:hypothetical protein